MGSKTRLFSGRVFGLFLLFLQFLFFSCSSGDQNGPSPQAEEKPLPYADVPIEDRLPLISITTDATIVDEPKVDAEMTIVEKGEESYAGPIGIEFRGSSSQSFPKKSFGLETRDANNEDLDVSLLGFPEEEDWILYGPYSDKSLLRNVLVFDLAREIGRYASRCKFVELRINGFYLGTYVFMEKLKRDSGRIDLNNLKEDENTGEDVTGGYVIKIDRIAGSEVGASYDDQISFMSEYPPVGSMNGQSIYFLYDDPDSEAITEEQKTYISTYVEQFEDALAADDFTDPEHGYNAYVDIDSFIDFFLLTELANNVDGYRLSTFMQKDKNEKLKMGPLWDFNLAFGNANYCGGGESNVWAYRFNERCPTDFWQVPFWWQRLLEDPTFVSSLQNRWVELRANVLATDAILSKIDQYRASLHKAGAVDSNFNTWPVLGTYVWPNKFVGRTHDEELDYLKGWLSDRLMWLDGAISQL